MDQLEECSVTSTPLTVRGHMTVACDCLLLYPWPQSKGVQGFNGLEAIYHAGTCAGMS